MNKNEMKKAFQKIRLNSLQIRLIWIIIFFMCIPVIILSRYNQISASSILENKTSALIMENLRKSANQLNYLTQEITSISSNCEINSNIMQLLEQAPDTSGRTDSVDFYKLSSDEVIRDYSVESNLSKIKSTIANTMSNVIIIGEDGMLYTSLDDASDELTFKQEFSKIYPQSDWYKELHTGSNASMWIAPFYFNVDSYSKDSNIALARTLKNSQTNRSIGIIIVSISEKNFADLSLNYDGTIAMINQNNTVIYSSNAAKGISSQNMFSKEINFNQKSPFLVDIKGTKYMVDYVMINELDSKLVSMIPVKEIMKEITALNNQIVIIDIIVLFVFMTLCLFIILHMTNPLKKLILNLKKSKIGRYSVDTGLKSNIDDVSGIVSSFEYLFHRTEELVKVVFDEQEKKHELEYEALRAQINPHFLFNTLNSIKWTATMSGTPNVAKMIASLGSLLEVSMSKGEEEIPLKDEIELTRSYIYIQNVRNCDKFVLETCIVPEIYTARIPRLILQPIVENSIIHGFAQYSGPAKISITARKENTSLIIYVDDNGSGIDQQQIQSLVSAVPLKEKGKFSGIGLRNVNERIKLKYGKEYGLSIMPGSECGTRVIIKLPYLEEGTKKC